MAGLLGAPKAVSGAQNSAELQDLAKFAVREHNTKQNAKLEFGKIVDAKQQVVAGTVHILTIEATAEGRANRYEAKVWTKPWENFKSLEEFKHLGPALTGSDLGSMR
eukprot:TRINITY_DN26437_c0_g1_i1.p1 TRINITY_DN26437_c0_g1~~TRINITY_DN26437_c0_g1_i1.p1  ORF type:complete len:107 (-),score=17.37 TRINITY_DN26437_c0_g1_i1:637-957(-)